MPPLMLSPEQLSSMLPMVTWIINWLRHCEPKTAGERFTRAGANMDQTQAALRELLNAGTYNAGDLTNIQLRYIFSCHDVATWATAVRVLLGESDPRLVPQEVGTALTASLANVNDSDESDEIAKILGSTLDQLPRSNFEVFGEFCALLRDTCPGSDATQLACLVGPMLLAPRVGMVATSVTSSAAAVMEFLIEEAEAVFGRPASFGGKKDAFGTRRPPPQPRRMSRQMMGGSAPGLVAAPSAAPNAFATGHPVVPPPRPVQNGGSGLGVLPPPGLGAPGGSQDRVDPKAAREQKRRDQLRAFFQFRANERVKDMSDCVEELFANHDFEDIAKGLFERYNMLPPGWAHEIAQVREEGSTKLDWFKNVPMPGNTKSMAMARTPVPKSPAPNPEKREKVDLIIDEIIDTEETYRENLEELLTNYITPVRAIATGRKGPEQAEELGITAQEVEKIFGWRIGEIVKISAALQKKLEVVSLVRTPPRSPLGRAGLVANAFNDISEELHVYAPYVSAHKTSLQTLEVALSKVQANQAKKGGAGLLGSALLRGKEKESVSFVKLWEQVSNNSPRLKNQSIQSLLILPIQRVPRYKLLLGELIKGTPKEHPAHDLLVEALDQVGQAAKQINEALRQHEKLGKFFGADDMLSPSISENVKGGKIKQSYVDA